MRLLKKASGCGLLIALCVWEGADVRASVNDAAAATQLPPATAVRPVVISSIAPTPAGVLVNADAPVLARISNRTTVEGSGGEEGFATVTIDFPGAEYAGAETAAEWTVGPFSSMRLTAYRTEVESGIRLHLVTAVQQNWQIQPITNGVMITGRSVDSIFGVPDISLQSGGSGSVRVSFNSALTSFQDEVDDYHRGNIAFTQRLRGIGTLSGFLTDALPRTDERLPRFALGLTDIIAGDSVLGIAGGDLAVTYGLESSIATSYSGYLQIRGGAVAALLPGGFTAEVFTGEGFGTELVFFPGEVDPLHPLTDNRVSGAIARWLSLDRSTSAAAAVSKSDLENGISYYNVLGAVGHDFTEDLAARLTLELSNGDDTSGYAATIEGDASFARGSFNGFYRYASPDFLAPVGAAYFATLRETYSANGFWEPDDLTRVSVQAAQQRQTSLFDREGGATLVGTRSITASRELSDTYSALAYVTHSEIETEPGAFIQAGSSTFQYGGGVSRRTTNLTNTFLVGRIDTENELRPERSSEGTRVQTSAQYRHDDHVVGASLRYEHLDRTIDDRDSWGGSISYSTNVGVIPVRASLSHNRSIAESERNSEQTRADLVVRPFGPRSQFQDLALVLSYQRSRFGLGEVREGYSVRVDGSKLLRWGQDFVMAPLAFDAFDVSQLLARGDDGRLRIVAFIDADGNGQLDAGEQPLSGARFLAGSSTISTASQGFGDARLRSGRHLVEFDADAALIDFIPAKRTQEVEIRARRTEELRFAFVPAGRIRGRLIAAESVERPELLRNVRVIATRNDGLRRVTSADDEGSFSFGRLPIGTYTVTLDRTSLDPGLISEQESLTAEVAQGMLIELEFNIRKATARERFGVGEEGARFNFRRP